MDIETTVLGEQHDGLMHPDVLESWKRLAVRLVRFRKLAQQVEKAIQRWDLRQLRQRISDLATAAGEVQSDARAAELLLAEWTASASAAGVSAYAAELKRVAAQLKLPLNGEFPDYEVFPLTLRLDLVGEQAVIGRRRTATLEPSALLRELQRQHQVLQASSFNARRFMQALVAAYDLLAGSGTAKGRGVALSDIYDILTLRTGSAGYTKQEFAFDIYRLRRESDLVHDGRRLSFQHARRGGIPVPNAQGGVENFGTLELWEVETGD